MQLRWEDFDLQAGRITNCSTKRQSPAPLKWLPGFKLPLLGSNQDSSDPESAVEPSDPCQAVVVSRFTATPRRPNGPRS